MSSRARLYALRLKRTADLTAEVSLPVFKYVKNMDSSKRFLQRQGRKRNESMKSQEFWELLIKKNQLKSRAGDLLTIFKSS
jgi:hypothetical protein